ncbi:MAG TPA: DUF998 domain-containing protein [Kofleriaceae bacterium]|nr:DUF998 domain-containing protein [Kofleriaceae bacterium]
MNHIAVRRRPVAAAQVALVGCALFVALLALLHLVRPEIDPSWHFISEYAIGENGWLMGLAFFSLALGYLALAVALAPHLRGLGGRVGLALLAAGAVGLGLAGLFPMDPLMTHPDDATTSGTLHHVGGTLGIALPLAALVVSWKLARDPDWRAHRRRIAWAGIAAVVASAASMVALGAMLSESSGQFGPDVPVGWPNRLEILAGCAWLAVVARARSRR